MLILMKAGHTPEQLEKVCDRIKAMGFVPHVIPGELNVAIGVTGNSGALDPIHFRPLAGVAEAIPVTRPYKLAGRQFSPKDSEVKVGDVVFGPGRFVVIAGPCAVESEDQTLRIARAVKAAGAHVLRGGAFKPRSSPYSFQGLGAEGLRILALARQETGLPVVTEALDPASLEAAAEVADIIQIGARNMQNFSLLGEAGRLRKPILLKRGMSATLTEWLMAAEYILDGGNPNVILCERGVRSFDPYTRNLLDLSAVPAIRDLSHLPIVVDPSHATGRRSTIEPMAVAALAAGASSVMVEVHDRPEEALCDGPQALLPAEFERLIGKLRRVAGALDMEMLP